MGRRPGVPGVLTAWVVFVCVCVSASLPPDLAVLDPGLVDEAKHFYSTATTTTTSTPLADPAHRPVVDYLGYFHNLAFPQWGRVDDEFFRAAPFDYADGQHSPSGGDRPNPRTLSRRLMGGASGRGSVFNRTALLTWFGQQLVEEVMDGQRPGCPPEYHNIPIPKCDPLYDPDCTGTKSMPFRRARYNLQTGRGPGYPRNQLNEISPWMDGNLMYGPGKAWADAIRSYQGGRLATDASGLMPPSNGLGLPFANPPPPVDNEFKDARRMFMIGNPRGHENPMLLALHVLWHREHNFHADRIAEEHPDWADERVFHAARRWVIAIHQHIAFNEWLPAFVGAPLPAYTGPKHVHPGVTHAFQSAAMRFGHTLVPPGMFLRGPGAECPFDVDGNFPGHHPRDANVPGTIRTCNSYWNSIEFLKALGPEPLLRGAASQVTEREDSTITEDLRGFVFGPHEWTRRDLMAMNIQRGRERGVPPFNDIRQAFGLPRLVNMSDVTDDGDLVAALVDLYDGDVNQVDLWVGGLLEGGTTGPGQTFATVLLEQFGRIRDGDVWYFENNASGLFSEVEVAAIRATKLSHVLRRNGVGPVQEDVFFWRDGDVCPQPHQLNGSDPSHLTPCSPPQYFDYYSTSRFHIAGIAVGIFWYVVLVTFVAWYQVVQVPKHAAAESTPSESLEEEANLAGEPALAAGPTPAPVFGKPAAAAAAKKDNMKKKKKKNQTTTDAGVLMRRAGSGHSGGRAGSGQSGAPGADRDGKVLPLPPHGTASSTLAYRGGLFGGDDDDDDDDDDHHDDHPDGNNTGTTPLRSPTQPASAPTSSSDSESDSRAESRLSQVSVRTAAPYIPFYRRLRVAGFVDCAVSQLYAGRHRGRRLPPVKTISITDMALVLRERQSSLFMQRMLAGRQLHTPGAVGFDDFCAMLRALLLPDLEYKLRFYFWLFDHPSSGRLQYDEFRTMVSCAVAFGRGNRRLLGLTLKHMVPDQQVVSRPNTAEGMFDMETPGVSRAGSPDSVRDALTATPGLPAEARVRSLFDLMEPDPLTGVDMERFVFVLKHRQTSNYLVQDVVDGIIMAIGFEGPPITRNRNRTVAKLSLGVAAKKGPTRRTKSRGRGGSGAAGGAAGTAAAAAAAAAGTTDASSYQNHTSLVSPFNAPDPATPGSRVLAQHQFLSPSPNPDAGRRKSHVSFPGRSATTSSNTSAMPYSSLHDFRKYLFAHRGWLALLVLYASLNVVVFVERYYTYNIEREHRGLRQITGMGVPVTRGAASGIMFNMCLALIISAKRLTSILRTSWVGPYLPLAHMTEFHIVVGWTVGMFTLVHLVGHFFNFFHVSTQPWFDVQCLFREVYLYSHKLPSFGGYWLTQTMTGFTGVLLVLVMVPLFMYALPCVRNARFRVFKRVHVWCTVLAVVLSIFHGAAALVQAPAFPHYLALPVLIMVVEFFLRIPNSRHLRVVRIIPLASGVTRVDVERPLDFKFDAGQHVQLTLTPLGRFTSRPFTITSSPHDDVLSFHVSSTGPNTWTGSLAALARSDDSPLTKFVAGLELDDLDGDGVGGGGGGGGGGGVFVPSSRPSSASAGSSAATTKGSRRTLVGANSRPNSASGGAAALRPSSPVKLTSSLDQAATGASDRLSHDEAAIARIDGPFGASFSKWDHYDAIVMFAGGIGVTPFVSILRSLLSDLRFKKFEMKRRIRLQRVYFCWASRTQNQWEWLVELLAQLKEEDEDQLLETHMFLTAEQDTFDIRLSAVRNSNEQLGRVVRQSSERLYGCVHFGRPDFVDILAQVQHIHLGSTVGILSCGPPAMASAVSSAVMRRQSTTTPLDHNTESFY